MTIASAPPGAHPATISYGPAINTAAVLLSRYGNVPAERTAHLIGMLLGIPVSAKFVDKAASRLDSRLQDAGFDAAMQTALAAEPARRPRRDGPISPAAAGLLTRRGERDLLTETLTGLAIAISF